MQEDLFSAGTPEKDKYRPLAYRMRPLSLDEFSGQEQAVGKKGYLRGFLEKGSIPSIIFWGPPGTGKTTLAMIIAKHINAEFIPLSAVNSGTKEVKEVLEKARLNHSKGKKTIMFIDEIHRFNKSQQDGFLPHVENGTIILIGATTENPSFEVNSALLSRARVITLKPLEEADIRQIVLRAVNDKERGLGKRKIGVHDDAFKVFDLLSNGDARTALNILEMIDNMKTEESYEITVDDIKEVTEKNTHFTIRAGKSIYNIISVLHKSYEDSDRTRPYWAARMMESGDAFIRGKAHTYGFAKRRQACRHSNALLWLSKRKRVVRFSGQPGGIAIIQSAVYMATAPKSTLFIWRMNLVKEDLKNFRDDPVPMHIRNAQNL